MTWSDPALGRVANVIAETTGLVFPPSRQHDVEGALRRALPSLSDPERLRALLEQDDEAREALISELTVGETYFFRDSHQFGLLRTLITRLGERHPHRPLRIWCAGCASGEEPYSIAIMCDQLGLGGRVGILGTDLSRTRLAGARRGAYRPWSFRGVAPDIVDRYFERRGSLLHISAALRSRVEFRYLNLAEDRFPSLASGIWGMDVVLCRNVLIYFDRETIGRVAQRLVASLSDDGYLLLGASDPAIGELTGAEVTATAAGLIYRRCGAEPAVAGLALAGNGPSAPDAPLVGTPTRQETPADPSESAPATVSAPAAVAGSEADLESLEAAYRARDDEAADALAVTLIQRGIGGVRPWVVRIRMLANRGCLQEAGSAAAAALERYRDSAELLYLHAVLLSQSGRDVEAAAAARRALYLDPALIVAHLALANARSRTGDVASARRALLNAETLLERLPPEETVPAADGQSAARLRQLVRTHLSLLVA